MEQVERLAGYNIVVNLIKLQQYSTKVRYEITYESTLLILSGILLSLGLTWVIYQY